MVELFFTIVVVLLVVGILRALAEVICDFCEMLGSLAWREERVKKEERWQEFRDYD